eukprot:CCRYP_017429-RA/>CCRYP_017429-RA protein AED:0.45 eAED:0.63 QI:0/0/0/1/0/0/2/0/118
MNLLPQDATVTMSLNILAGIADDFSLQLWDKLLPQTEITLNLLHQSNATPTISTLPTSVASLTTTKCLLLHWGAMSKSMRRRINMAPGPSTPWMAGTSALHPNATAPTAATSPPTASA